MSVTQAWFGAVAWLLGLAVLWKLSQVVDPIAAAVVGVGALWLVGASANDWARREWAVRGWRIADVVVARGRLVAPAGACPLVSAETRHDL